MPHIAARSRVWPVALLSICVTLGLVGCTRPGSVSPIEQSAAAAPPPAAAKLAISPAIGATALPVSTEIGLTLTDGELAGIRLVKAATGQELAGTLRPDGSSWVPLKPLEYGTAYEATVTAKGLDGQLVSQTTSFTTMAAPGRYVDTGLYAFNGQKVGVAMPIVVQFDREIPAEARPAIQERLFVTTDPPQPGVWSWVGGRQVLYRAPDYWKPGTTITVRSALKGVPIGNSYGDTDREATVTVADNKVFMYVDNKAKHMQVYVNDTLTRTMPVSLGKASTPSSSGFMVTMSREPWATFDTRGEPNGGYVVDVQWAHRLTWGGEFIHSAPWSVGSQGRTNVSHGCVNLAPGNAKWLFDQIQVGTPIIVRGTERTLEYGNGWTAWSRPWSEYVKGSALPVPDELANAPAVDHLTGAPPPRPATPAPTTSAPTPSHSVDPAAVPT